MSEKKIYKYFTRTHYERKKVSQSLNNLIILSKFKLKLSENNKLVSENHSLFFKEYIYTKIFI